VNKKNVVHNLHFIGKLKIMLIVNEIIFFYQGMPSFGMPFLSLFFLISTPSGLFEPTVCNATMNLQLTLFLISQ
jgi:hypothetical protein